jgi:multidrug resistance protein MdtO
MASIAQSLPQSSRPLNWLLEFLKEELAPYKGRVALVARMTTAATLIMLVGMTFHLSYAWQGAIYALLVSRESTRATLQTAATIFVVTGIGTAYALVSMGLFINIPLLHFVWIIGTLFVAFFAMSSVRNYIAVVAFVNLIAAQIPLWDRHVSAETNVEDTFRLLLATLVAVVITAAVELVFVRLRRGDEIVLLIAERLSAVENLLTCYAEGRPIDRVTEQNLIRLGTLGISLLRRILRRSDYSVQQSVEMGGVAALMGRLVDLGATLTQLSFDSSAVDQRRFRNLASAVGTIRDELMNGRIPGPIQFNNDGEPASFVPLLGEIEHTVTLIPAAFGDARSIQGYLPSEGDMRHGTVIVPDAFQNPDHFRFALKGCLAASICYVIYNAIAWPGISTAVTTCMLTALSTTGSSRQKQALRITGAMVGGFLLGMGSQMFVLPYIDSVFGFTVLFILVTAFASWFMTSSPRLSYFGLQVALAFYLITLNESKMQISLAVARDRVVGILLGLIIMWLVFDRLWGMPAAVQMKNVFISNLRLVAQFAREPVPKDLKAEMRRSLALRETIATNLDKVRALADGVLFEFGSSRDRDLALRNRIRQWQPNLRMLFILEIATRKYRARLPGFELPETMIAEQLEFDDDVARTLDAMADQMEGRLREEQPRLGNRLVRLERSIESYSAEVPQDTFGGRLPAFLALYRRIASVGTSLQQEMSKMYL